MASDLENFDFSAYVRDIEDGKRSTVGVERFLAAIRESECLRVEFLENDHEESTDGDH